MELEKRIKYIKNMQPHKVKNTEVTEDGFYITSKQLEKAIRAFEKLNTENKKVLRKKPLN